MHVNKNLMALALAGRAWAALVFDTDTNAEFAEAVAIVNAYNGETCGGYNTQTFTITGDGVHSCKGLSNAKSIQVSGSGCNVTAWTGNDCRGDVFEVPNSNCQTVSFGSVMAEC
ncbi:hypothetical protein F4780DRAFT_415673 [Xylariomycetidae sp. FL0641]|nr:hypothetical protein F4780DRAFT_415673 [Xylariomycetidae sp. FL0641]